MDCSTPSYRQSLQQITTVAKSIKPSLYSALSKAGIQPPSKINGGHNLGPIPPALGLSLPDEIISSLLDLGCPQETAKSLSNVFINSVNQIRDAYEASYQKLALQFISDPDRFSTRLQNTRFFLERKYREQILMAERVAVEHARKLRQVPHTKPKSVFNQEFVPFLETYFEYNAYPSAPDRASLAKKSMMTIRQIEVWFQNHRNRAKKEGRPLRKLSSDSLPLGLSFESLRRRMPLFLVPETERKLSISSHSTEDDHDSQASSDTKTEKPPSTFRSEAPSHAFPTTFPPHCDYDPFPVKTKSYSFSSPIWMRTPGTTLPPRTIPTMDEIIVDFSTKLVIRDQTTNQRQKGTSPPTPKPVWFAATRTIPSPAPHPAFIPLETSVQVSSISQPPTRVLPTKSLPSQSAKSFSRYATPPVGTQSRGHTAGRKVAPLPRRSPGRPSYNHRNVSPPIPEALLPPLSPSNFRLSSFDSALVSNRHTSSSSSSSSFSSTLNTPVSSPKPLPNNSLSPSIANTVDLEFQDAANSFRDTTLPSSPDVFATRSCSLTKPLISCSILSNSHQLPSLGLLYC